MAAKQLEIQIDKRIFNDFYTPYLFDFSHKIEVHKGSAGSGKSVWVTQKNVLRAMQEKRTVLFVRKVGTTLRDSCWELVLNTLEQFQYLDKVKINKNEFRMTFPNGSVFLFKSMDDEQKIKSIVGISDLVLEEASELVLSDYTQLLLRLRTKSKFPVCYIMFNPVSKTNWTFSTFKFTEENQTEPIREYDNVIVFCTTYKNNKFLSADYIKTLEDMEFTNYNDFLVYTKGLFCSLDKKVFTNWVVKDFDWKEIKKEYPDSINIFSLDFGFTNDPTALVCALVNEEKKELFIYQEHFEKGMLNTDIAKMLKDKGIAKEIIMCDGAEPKSVAELKQLGIVRAKSAKKGKGSIMQGIQKLQQYKIHIHSSCPNMIKEFQNYSFKLDKQTNEYTNELVDNGFCHGIDSLRYGMTQIKKKIKPINIRF